MVKRKKFPSTRKFDGKIYKAYRGKAGTPKGQPDTMHKADAYETAKNLRKYQNKYARVVKNPIGWGYSVYYREKKRG